jgi:DNA-binding NtrC family response regulator
MNIGQDVSSAAQETKMFGAAGEGPDIFILADQTPQRAWIEGVLRRAGCVVVSTPHSQAMRLLLHGHPPAAVLIDLEVAGEDGWDWLATCRRRHPHVALVFMSHRSQAWHAELGCEEAEILREPFTAVELLSAVGLAVARRTFSPGLNPAGRPTYYGPAG